MESIRRNMFRRSRPLRQKAFSTKWFSRQSVVRQSVGYPLHFAVTTIYISRNYKIVSPQI